MKNTNSGFTLVEVLIASSLFIVVTLATIAFLVFFNQRSVTTQTRLNSAAGQMVGQAYIGFDIQNAAPSYNNVADTTGDDNGYNFFDYLPGEVCSSASLAYCTRQITLNAPTPFPAKAGVEGQIGTVFSKPFEFVITDVADGPPIAFNPVRLYSYVSPTLTMSAAAPNNLPSILGALPYTSPDCAVGDLQCSGCLVNDFPCSNMWQSSRYLQFYSPAYLQPVDKNGVPLPQNALKQPISVLSAVAADACGASTPANGTCEKDFYVNAPKQPSFFGLISAGALSAASLDTTTTVVQLYYPDPSTGVNYANIDSYFRALPSLGGAGLINYVRVVQVVHYLIQQVFHNNQWTYQLVRETYNGGKSWINTEVILSPITQIVFSRQSVSLPTINVQINAAPAAGTILNVDVGAGNI